MYQRPIFPSTNQGLARIFGDQESEEFTIVMRILYLHQYFNTPQMPGGTRSYEMARFLVKSGHEVNMVTSARTGECLGRKTWFETEEAGIKVHWMPVAYSNSMPDGERLKAFLKFALGAAQKAASLKADVVFATSTPLTIAIPAVYSKWKLKAPMVFEVRDLWPELPIAVGALKNKLAINSARWLERFAYRNSEHIIALSPDMKEGILKTGYPSDQVSVIPNSSDLHLFSVPPLTGNSFRSKRDWLGNRPLVVYTGTLGRINGVSYLVRMAQAVQRQDPEICFLIIGNGQERGKLKKLAQDCGVLNRNLFMLSEVPKVEMPSILNAADVALSLFINLQPMWANSANKFFDAIASGTPIAINYGGWQADIIKAHGIGFCLPPDNPRQAAKILVKHIRDRVFMNQAAVAARHVAETEFSRNSLAKQMEQTLLIVVKSSKRGKPS